MEESDDDLSFASASDTDHETESFVDCPTISTPNSVEVLRTSSPASSLASRSSFRRRKAPKRPAPQPPGRKSPQKVVDSSEVSPSSTNAPSRPPTNHSENVKVMTSFLQEFHKNSVMEEPSGSSCVPPLQIEKPLTEFVSHPIHLVSQNEETPTNLSSPSAENVIQEISEREPSPSAFRRDLSHLQLRLIDDVAEPLSQSFPLSSTAPHSSPLHSTYLPKGSVSPYSSLPSLCSDQPLSYHQPLNAASPMPSALPSQSPVLSHPYLSQGNMASYPAPLSTIYSDLPATSQPLPDAASTPFYLASVNPNQMVPLPSQPSLPSGAPHPYVNVTPLTYVTQFPSFSGSPSFVSAPTSAGLPGSPLPKGMRVVRNPLPLSHSASDPGVNRILRGGYLVPPTGTGSLLDRLSETEERDHSDEDNDEVFLRQQSNGSSNRDLVSVGTARKVTRRSRSERYDSVGVPQLYEDFVLSSRFRLKVTFTNLTMVVIGVALLMPNSAAILYNFFRLVFGTLFPAYYSYKAVRTKNVKEYVKWMMYWIVFAFFTCAETITDVFLSFWFPFYYEIKILVVLWLLSPATRGSSILYRKFVHPWLTRKEEEIDECIAKAKQQGYSTVVQLGTKGVNYATSVIMQTAIKGGGGLVSQLKRSYSASEIGEDTADHNRNVKALPAKENIRSPSEDDDTMSVSSGSYESEPRHRAESESSSNRLRGHSTGRSIRAGKTRSADVSETYFHETAEVMPQRRSPRTHDAGRYMQPFLEPLQKEPLLRKSKHKYFSRPKSMTIGGTSASREAWLEARRNYSSGSIYSNIPESPLESSNPSSFTPPRVSLSRNASRSFRSSLR